MEKSGPVFWLRDPAYEDELTGFEAFMSIGGPGWFATLVECLRDISGRHVLGINDQLLLGDLILDGWDDLAAMPKREAVRWIRCARIELDHLLVEDAVREIIEAREYGDVDLIKVLLSAFPVDIELRKEIATTARRNWIKTAKLAARGKLKRIVPVIYPGYAKTHKVENVTIEDEALLEYDRARRCEAICGVKPQIQAGIYFVTSDHALVKIGYATDVAARVRTLQTSVPHPLHILLVVAGTLADERTVHRRFAADRLRGEWFNLSPAIEAFIRDELAKRAS